MTAQRQPQNRRIYVTRLGDSLGGIAMHFYGNPREWVRIHAANRDQLSANPNHLMTGMHLHIP